MSMSYSMILVAAEPYFRPEARRVITFLEGLLELGAVGELDAIRLRNHQKSRARLVGRNPRTGEAIEHRSPESIGVGSVQELSEAMRGLTDFDAVISGTGPARLLPARYLGGYDDDEWKPLDELIACADYEDDYELSVECCQRSRLSSTSDLHEETPTDRTVTPFGEPCELGDRVGLYSNPETLELIKVPSAGCATFWIVFNFGNWLFPKFDDNRIDFVEPVVLQCAETSFGAKFAEGCSWG